MSDQADLPHLTPPERDHYERAKRFLERTDLVADKPGRGVNQETLYEGRYAARGVLLMANRLNTAATLLARASDTIRDKP